MSLKLFLHQRCCLICAMVALLETAGERILRRSERATVSRRWKRGRE